VKHIIVAALAVAMFCGACTHEDTADDAMWRRTVEPRLTTTQTWHRCEPLSMPGGRVVAEVRCAEVTLQSGRCDQPIGTREDAVSLLVTRKGCVDRAISALERLSITDAAAMSDVAAAYYIRAQRNDNATDLLHALPAANHAVAMVPAPAGARFNRALILEALELNEDAAAAWNDVAAHESGEWAHEAGEHRDRIRRKLAIDGERQWKAVQLQINAALDKADVATAARAIALFPASAEKYFEESVLPEWARKPSPDQAARVRVFGDALSQVLHDRFAADVARAVVNSQTPEQVTTVRQAHITLQRARAAYDGFSEFDKARALYIESAALLERAGSPLSLIARIGAATALELTTASDAYARAVTEFNRVREESAHRGYDSVTGRLDANLLTALVGCSRYTEALAAHDRAAALFTRIGDAEDLLTTTARLSGLLGLLGMKERSFAEALVQYRKARGVHNIRTWLALAGAMSVSSIDLGFPDAALLYQTSMVNRLRTERTQYSATALWHRAAIELRLNRNADAERDLAEARKFKPDEPGVKRAFEARLQEVEGQALMHVDPQRGVAALTTAIHDSEGTEYLSFRALLLIERAHALQAARRPAEAERDLEAAIDLLRNEEKAQLAARPVSDQYWGPYFSRFTDAYELLIRQLIDENRSEEAFQYAERERAFEPIDLILKLPNAPPELRRLASAPKVEVAALRQQLPPNTYIVEYCVTDDQTFAWVVSRDTFVRLTLRAKRSDVRRWAGALQDAAKAPNRPAFDAGLLPPYDELVAKPLEVIRAADHTGSARVVFVPDDALHGLPFAALRNPITKRYVIEERPVAIAGSALLYVFSLLRDRKFSPSDNSALLVGDPDFDRTKTLTLGLPRLPAARDEVEQIRSLYARNEVLTGANATADSVLRLATTSGIVHIAAHAIANGSAPSQSYVVLAPSATDDGILDAETLRKRLDARHTRLVVLGACSSAAGTAVSAAGIAPLVRPILAAGVPGVIGSLWDVSDATAARVLVSFHRHYRQGLDAAAALQAAQLDELRSNAGHGSAMSWAPFQAIGFASSPFGPTEEVRKKEKPP
jgi:CHAT domain-containing protein